MKNLAVLKLWISCIAGGEAERVEVQWTGMGLGSWGVVGIERTLLWWWMGWIGSVDGSTWPCPGLDGGQGEMAGLGRDVAQQRRATRAWHTWYGWHWRGFGWQWGKAGDDGLGDAAVAWWNKPSHHSLGAHFWEEWIPMPPPMASQQESL